ncbi:MAG: autotransporter-associated beta strand repeat-containing protein [Planctomycetota bacterium]|nr:autotransporter-associated beta strand repeat-containing protein [Planctomycetota bacterium]
MPARTVSRSALHLTALLMVLGLLPASATAATKTWIDGTGQWDVADNWSPTGQPQAGDDVYLTQTDALDRTVTYYNTSNPTDLLGSLTIDATGTGTMTLDMPNAHLLNVKYEYIGYSGKGAMTIQGGAQFSNIGGYIGYNSGSTGTATLTGAGSKWTNSGDLYIGRSGNGALSIEQSSQVSNTSAYLGYYAGSSGTATVTGAGSKWTNSGYLYVGSYGRGTLNVEAGGQVSNANGSLGEWSGSSGTVTVTGAGSKWTNSSSLYVGLNGSGMFSIQAGGKVSNTNGYLGLFSGGTGAVTVTGAGSTWTNSGSLSVGNEGSGTLTVTDGGEVSAYTLFASLGNLLGNGTITVTRGAVLDADLVFDATHGTTKTFSFGTGGTLNLSLTSAGDLGAGYKGNGTLRIADGVSVTSVTGYVGYRSGSTGTATVTGAGSTWTNSGGLYVGESGRGTLNIQGGAQVSNTGGYLGWYSGSTGTAMVTGTGSRWNNSSSLNVGRAGNGTLNIEAGGEVTDTGAYVGDSSGSTSTVTVTGAGSTWTNTGNLYVGYSGNGTLNIEAGGQVSNFGAIVGNYSGSTGRATVSGAGSTWTNSGYLLNVGNGGNGTLTIQAGGQVSSKEGAIGWGSGSTGTVNVDGSGSAWNNSGSLYVGGNDHGPGGTASLTVKNGGQMTVGGTLRLWKANSAVTVDGGTLRAGPLWGTTGTIRITDPVGSPALTVGSEESSIFSGVIRDHTGPGSFLKVGSGVLTLGGANTFTGNTLISAGTLRLTNNLALQNSALDTSGAGTLDVTSINTPTFGGLVGSVNLALPANITALTLNPGSGTTTYSGKLSGGTGMTLTKTGAGTQVLSGANTYTGATAVSVGTLRLGTNTALPSGRDVTVDGGTLDVGVYSLTLGAVTLTDGTITGTTGVLSASFLDVRKGTISAKLGGTGGLTKTTTDTVTLTAANLFTGPTIVSQGTLLLGAGNAIPSASSVTVQGSSTLNIGASSSGAGAVVLVDGTITGTTGVLSGSSYDLRKGTVSAKLGGTGGLTKTAAGTVTLTAANTFTGGITVSGGTLALASGGTLASGNSLVVQGGGTLNIGACSFAPASVTLIDGTITGTTGVLSGSSYDVRKGTIGAILSSGGSLTKTTSDTVTLTAANTFTGGTTVSAGTLRLGINNALRGGRNVTVQGGGTLDLGPYSIAPSTVTLIDGTITGTTGVLTGSFYDFRKGIVDATLGGTGNLTKTTADTVTLSGANSFSGPTTISAGTLKLAAEATMASSLFDIAAGATLDVRDFLGGYTLPPGAGLMGGGTVLGDLVVTGAVAPGSSPGILSVEDIILAAGSTLEVELGDTVRGSGYDVLASSGSVTLQAGSTLAVTLINAFVPEKGDAFDILDFAALSGRFGTPTLPALGENLAWNTDGLYTSGVIKVVPEPASAALLMAGLAWAALRRRARGSACGRASLAPREYTGGVGAGGRARGCACGRAAPGVFTGG